MHDQRTTGAARTSTVAPEATGLDVQWPKTAFRVIFGLIWLIDAVLKWLPGFRDGYMDTIMGQSEGQPTWLDPWFNFWINLQHPNPAFFAYLVAVLETGIALAVIFGFARKLTYLSAIVLSLLIWGTAEGFGGPYTSGSADIGTAIIYSLVFALLLCLAYYQGPSRFSVDYYLEQRISWWHWIAEIGHRNHHPQAATPEHLADAPAIGEHARV
ncbi:MAG: DoxX family membrane protein [Frankiales bacterium]|nr:DoxX family membrane protein [Frankiales bacterium]